MPSKPTGEDRLPPTFEPSARQSRPAADDARPVGPAPRRTMARPSPPARPVPPASAAAAGAPPAIEPDATHRAAPPRRSRQPARPVPGRHPAQDAGPADAPVGTPRRTTPRGGGTAPRPAGPSPAGGGPHARPAAPAAAPRRRWRRRGVLSVLALVLVLVLAWPIGLAIWANGRLRHVDALSGAADTPGTTYLLAGSDERAPGEEDGTAGARADTIMLLQVPESGPRRSSASRATRSSRSRASARARSTPRTRGAAPRCWSRRSSSCPV